MRLTRHLRNPHTRSNLLVAATACLFAGTAAAYEGGLKPPRIGAYGLAQTAWLHARGDTVDDTAPAPAARRSGHGLALSRGGFLDRVTPLGSGLYYTGSREDMRLGLRASENFHGMHVQLSPLWSYQLQSGLTRGSSAAPMYSVSGQLQAMLSPGWGLSLGLRYSTPDAVAGMHTRSSQPEYGLDSGVRWHLGQVTAGSAMQYQLQLNYHYGLRNSLGMSYASGRPAEEFMYRGLAADDARQFNLYGSHWFSPDWALNYGVSGELTGRQGLHLGVRYRF
jgi:hypothetical protein